MTFSLRFKRDCGREMPLLAEFERTLIKARTGGLDRHRERRILLGAGCGRSTVGWFYFRHNEETARQAKVLNRDEAPRMAVELRGG
jgi:hypothetical protein